MFGIKVAILDETKPFADDNKQNADGRLNEEKEEGHVEATSRDDKLPNEVQAPNISTDCTSSVSRGIAHLVNDCHKDGSQAVRRYWPDCA